MVDALAEKGTLFRAEAERQIAKVMKARGALLDQVEHTEYSNLQTHYANAVFAAQRLRDLGDLIVASFFSAAKWQDRLERRNYLLSAYESGQIDVVSEAIHGLRTKVAPFHWETEFPEVFERGGFDSICGNPPFLGGAGIWPKLGAAYRDFLKMIHRGSDGKAVDLVAHFIRRAFELARRKATIGIIATNTIAQGDTRTAGLKFIVQNGGRIFAAVKRMAWPGEAAVIVSVVFLSKDLQPPCVLDGKPVPGINSLLLGTPLEVDATALKENQHLSFRGHVLLGMGFTFDDSDESGPSSQVSEMYALIAKNPLNAERILPYIGGAETNSSPTQSPHRFAINFADLTLTEAQQWPDLLEIVRRTVLPERSKLGGYSVAEKRNERWWQFGTYAAALQTALAGLSRCLVLSRVSTNHAVVFQPTSRLFADSLVVFPFSTNSAFAILQSRVHETWARFFGSSMKDDLRYTPSNCFETFPFPPSWKDRQAIECIGEEYCQFRADVMVRNNEGLTKTYNRFHDKYEDDAEIQRLRDLHAQMDRAVLDAYGWTDLQPVHDFILDYESPEEEQESGRTRNRKAPWRYRWTDEFRDKVLARLLELNRLRAEEECKGAETKMHTPIGTKAMSKKTRNKAESAAPTLAGWEEIP
jgi:hypothetical protein